MEQEIHLLLVLLKEIMEEMDLQVLLVQAVVVVEHLQQDLLVHKETQLLVEQVELVLVCLMLLELQVNLQEDIIIFQVEPVVEHNIINQVVMEQILLAV